MASGLRDDNDDDDGNVVVLSWAFRRDVCCCSTILLQYNIPRGDDQDADVTDKVEKARSASGDGKRVAFKGGIHKCMCV